jgi:GT2 family glycosyltransferase
MLLTIVVTTFNRKNVLRRLLESLEEQSDSDFQVVVAIDGSTDETEQMLRTIQTSYSLKWVNTHCKKYGLAVARNMGILAADGEMIAIIDDDCFPSPKYVASHKHSVKHLTITGGPRTPASNKDIRQKAKMLELDRLPACEAFTFRRLRQEWPRAVATECNICMYREDLINMGLFSERLKIYGFIGQEFFARAEHFGFQYQYNPEAEMVHHRQPVGDNELTRWKRKWQTIMASALRPSLMNPRQYEAQVHWAKRMSDLYPEHVKLPSLPLSIWVGFPYRFVRNRAGDVRRHLRNRKEQKA